MCSAIVLADSFFGPTTLECPTRRKRLSVLRHSFRARGCQLGCQDSRTAAPEWNGRSEFEIDFEVSPPGLEPGTS